MDVDRQQVDDFIGDKLSAESRRILLLWLTESSPRQRLLLLAEHLSRPPVRQVEAEDNAIFIPLDLLTDAMTQELPAANLLWRELQDLPFEQQVLLLRERGHFKSPVFFLYLREASRLANRDDRDKGLELAKLAMVSVRLLELLDFDRDTSENRSLAWAWMGNVHQLSLDFQQAEEAFRRAERQLPEGNCHPIVAGNLCFLRAKFSWFQRDFDQALDQVEQAINLYADDDLFRLQKG